MSDYEITRKESDSLCFHRLPNKAPFKNLSFIEEDMEWMSRESVWEFTELGQDDFPVLTESSSTTEGNKSVDFFPVDRVLNGLGENMVNKTSEEKELVTSKETLASRRARGYNGNNQHTSCLVDGCTSDLSGCRDYHRRHRVCERHSKTPAVVIGGKEQRFCQQCSRFHSLGEFDDVKRSCRKRLDGHNRRRRKPQPESLYLTYGNFLANHQGAKLLQFGSPEEQTSAYSSSSITWVNDSKYSHQSACSNSTGHVYSGTQINFPFLLDKHNHPVPEYLNMQPSKGTPGKLTRMVKSRTAPSLLSSHYNINNNTTQMQSSRTCPSHLIMQQDALHLNNDLQFDGMPLYSHSQRTTQDLNGVSQFGMSEGLLENEASQLISFSCN